MNLNLLSTKKDIKLEDLKFRYNDLRRYPKLYSKKEKTQILSRVRYYQRLGITI